MVGKSITIHEDDNWLVVIPLDKEASCFHGRDTDWCTTKPDQSYFEQYFYYNEITLIYCISKKDGGKYAIAYHEDNDELEMFDKNDRSINKNQFQQATGFDPTKLIELSKKNNDNISGTRSEHKAMIAEIRSINFDNVKERDKRIEFLLRKTKDFGGNMHYMRAIRDKTPEEVQITLVTQNGRAIGSITEAGIKPSEKVQLAAVTQNGDAIAYIIWAYRTASEAVKKAAGGYPS